MVELFGTLPDGSRVDLVELRSAAARIALIGFGAAVQSIEVPDADGRWANVVLGLDSLADYVARSPHFGATPGRYAGRIAGGTFTLDGVRHILPRNDGPNTLHGGPHGFGKRAWTLQDSTPESAVFTLFSADGDGGFPGAVQASVTYTLRGDALWIEYHAETTRPTVINLTNHSYFNLAGEGSGSALGHWLTVHADRFAPIDAGGIPTGELRPVAGTPFDFRTACPVGARIRGTDPQLRHGLGYDHGFLVDGTGLRPAARLVHPEAGRVLVVSSTAPALQIYSGNSLTGALSGPSRRPYRQSDAVCLEAQHLPDSPNQPSFPSAVVRPEALYRATVVFRFIPARD